MSAAIRVMHVVQAMKGGGAESVVVEHARHAGAGIEVLVCALNEAGPALTAAAALGARTFDVSGAGRFAVRLLRLRALLRAERVTVVNAHNPTGALYGVLAARLAGVPVAFRTEHTVHYDGRHSAVYPLLEPLLTRLSDRVVCVCEAVRGSHARRLASAGPRFVSVPNGVSDVAPQQARAAVRAAIGLEPAEVAVLTVGSLRTPKAYHVLVDAFARLLPARPAARLVMAGEGPLRGALEQRAREQGCAARIVWLGHREDVSDLVEACDFFVLSSEREGLSLSLLEAMRGSRAAVVTNVGGNAEAVADGETGRVVPPHDAAALAAALRELVDDPDRRARWGAAARLRWRRSYTAERMVRDTEGLYRQALERRGVPAAVPAALPEDACA